jgi:GNAT superfamily N-acetyltransferase
MATLMIFWNACVRNSTLQQFRVVISKCPTTSGLEWAWIRRCLQKGWIESGAHLETTEMKRSNQFEIRPADVKDVPIILELIHDLAAYERAPHEVTATEEQLVDVLFGERPAAEVLIAFEGKSAIGFAVYFYNFSTWLGRPGLYLEDLFVKPDVRGKGYGRALLIELAKIARDRGCGRMEWAVLDWNEPAIKFYRALGAKPMHEWTVFRLTRDGIARLANSGRVDQEQE